MSCTRLRDGNVSSSQSTDRPHPRNIFPATPGLVFDSVTEDRASAGGRLKLTIPAVDVHAFHPVRGPFSHCVCRLVFRSFLSLSPLLILPCASGWGPDGVPHASEALFLLLLFFPSSDRIISVNLFNISGPFFSQSEVPLSPLVTCSRQLAYQLQNFHSVLFYHVSLLVGVLSELLSVPFSS